MLEETAKKDPLYKFLSPGPFQWLYRGIVSGTRRCPNCRWAARSAVVRIDGVGGGTRWRRRARGPFGWAHHDLLKHSRARITRARRRVAFRNPALLVDRVRATEHAPRGPFRVLERRHGLAEIVERGAGGRA